MGRPPLAVGTFGTIRTTLVSESPKKWAARTYIRDADGRRREVARWGSTKSAAESALKQACADRTLPCDDFSPEMTVDALIEWWLERLDQSARAAQTKRIYRGYADGHIRAALGGHRLRELTVPRVDAALLAIAERNGPSAAKSVRSVLSGMLGDAVRRGAIPTNPVRDTTSIAVPTEDPRALTLEEQFRVLDFPRSSARAMALDLPDLIDFMLGTGVRIGEACAIRRDVLDLEAGVVEINATVVRLKGVGLVVQERTKSDAGWRVLALPDDLVLMLRDRLEREQIRPYPTLFMDRNQLVRTVDDPGLLFRTATGKLRDPSNTEADLRRLLDGIDCAKCQGTGTVLDAAGKPELTEKGRAIRCTAGPLSWASSHVFRKTALTRLDEAGLPARVIADQGGHAAVSMTQDRYMGRKVVSKEAAAILRKPKRPDAEDAA